MNGNTENNHKTLKAKALQFKPLKKLPVRTMDWIGSVSSLVIHSILFMLSFILGFFEIFDWDRVLLVLTTLVSLEAIYMAIFIQMGVNRTNQGLQEVEEDIEEIAEDVGEIAEDVEGLGEDVVELQEGVVDIQEDIDEITEEDIDGQTQERQANIVLSNIESQLQYLVKEVEILKNTGKQSGQQK